jgi:SrtB family sortase
VSNIKDRLIKIIILLLIGIMLISCVACNNGNTIIDIDATPSPTPLPTIQLSQPKNYGMLAVGETFTAGLLYSGEVVTTGRVVGENFNTRDWKHCIAIASNDSTLAGITTDGKLQLTGEKAAFFAPALEWSNLISVALGENHIVGLTSVGHVLAYGDNSTGQCDTEEVYGITKIYAFGNTTILLKEDNGIIHLGKERDIPLTSEKIKEIAASESVIALLLENGRVIVDNEEYAISENLQSIVAYGEVLAGVTEENTLVCVPDTYKSKSKTISNIAIGKNNIALLKNNGSVEVFGNKDDYQGTTVNWRLRPTLNSKGYFTGFAAGTIVDDAKIMLSETLGKEVALKKEGVELSEGVVFTGAEVYNGTKLLGKIVIYGDINGDGFISNPDFLLLSKHVSGVERLTDIRLYAADTLHYVSGNGELSEEHILAIASHTTGSETIRQYNFDPYEQKIAEAYAKNPDVVGWIMINNTNIDFPLLYGPDFHYNFYTIDNRKSELGSIYPIYESFQKNNVVAGHNGRVNGLMFHMLHSLQENSKDLLVYKNRIIGTTVYHDYMEWEIFALYETGRHEVDTTLKYNISRMRNWSDTEVQEWIDTQVNRSEIKLGVEVTPDDTFLTLYTCGDYHYSDQTNQARLYIFLRRIG